RPASPSERSSRAMSCRVTTMLRGIIPPGRSARATNGVTVGARQVLRCRDPTLCLSLHVCSLLVAVYMGRKIRVMVVDDDAVLRHLVSDQVRRMGFDATPAASGEEALDALSRHDFD